MNNQPITEYLRSPMEIEAENARFMTRVYLWMTFGICLSAGIAWRIGSDPALVMSIAGNPWLFYGLMIGELVAVFTLSWAVKRISALFAAVLYLGYAALSGVTLSVIFLAYTKDSIASVFGLTAFSFAGLSGFGYFTKKDLGPIGSFCTMGLFGLLGYGLIALFFPQMMAGTAQKVYSLCGVIVFAGLTAYDTQKIKELNVIGNEGTDEDRKEAIYGALTLYLDFINLFLDLLRLLGKSRD
jgi:FtsH-binding integral membrane protein